MSAAKRAALYGRVSTAEQDTTAQLGALRNYSTARGWEVVEYVDQGVSGAKERRPALDLLLLAARRREVAVVVVTKLDRLVRSLHQLVALGREFEALGVDLVVLDQAIDTTTPAGRLLFHVLGAIAEFERDLIRERVVAGLRRAQERGTRSGRPIGASEEDVRYPGNPATSSSRPAMAQDRQSCESPCQDSAPAIPRTFWRHGEHGAAAGPFVLVPCP